MSIETFFHFPHSEDSVLVSIASFPVLPSGSIEIEVGLFIVDLLNRVSEHLVPEDLSLSGISP